VEQQGPVDLAQRERLASRGSVVAEAEPADPRAGGGVRRESAVLLGTGVERPGLDSHRRRFGRHPGRTLARRNGVARVHLT
jgi:hypothetical protein